MNILFAGSPKSSSEILDFLAKDPSLRIKGVLTQPDKKGKRGTRLYESEVARIAKEHNLNIFKPKTLDSPNFVGEIKNLDIDLVVIFHFVIENSDSYYQATLFGFSNFHYYRVLIAQIV